MSSEHVTKLKEILLAAVALPADKREGYLDRACGDDPELRADVEAKLRHFDHDPSILETDALDRLVEASARDGPDEPTITAADQSSLASQTIGPYRLLERIGVGGFGEVFAAEQTEPVKRRVALKVLKPGMDSKAVLARFDAERQALAFMDHPSIAKVLDAGMTEAGRPYFAMELVKGEPITAYCDRHTLSTKERLALFIPICRAVQHAHQKGIIHRDLKPSNILVTLSDGKPVPKVIDFGIAKATTATLTEKTIYTEQGQMIGTPEYMSPEQAEMSGLDIDTRTDVYSLGVVLYELLAGSLPFDRETLRKAGFAAMQKLIRDQEPRKPSTKVSTAGDTSTEIAKRHRTDVRTLARQLRGELDWITLKALEKDRTRRYETPNGLAMDIERYLADEAVLAGAPSALYRARKFTKRNKVAIGVVAAILITVSGALIQSTIQRARIQTARDESEAVTAFLEEMLASVDPAQQGKDVTVLEIMNEAAKTIGETFADQPLVEARLRHTMGRSYRKLGEFDAAEQQLDRAVEIRRRELGNEHPETLYGLYSLAVVYGNSGRTDESVQLLLPVLAAQHRILGNEHLRTLATESYLGAVYLDQQRFAEAESLLVPNVETARRVLGEEHPQTLLATITLGRLYVDQGLPESVEILVPLLETQRRALGDAHPQTLTTETQLAAVYRRQRRYAEAESLLEASVEKRRRVQGEDHPSTVSAMATLATVYANHGRLHAAESLLIQVLENNHRVHGEGHPFTVNATNWLGLVYRDQRRYAAAESLLTHNVEVARRLLGEDHSGTLQAMHNLSSVYRRQGRSDEYEALLVHILEGHRRTWGPGHPHTLGVATELALVHRNHKRYAEAESLLVQILNAKRESHGEEDSATLGTMVHLARVRARADPNLVEPLLSLLEDIADRANANAYQKNDCAWELLTCEPVELRDPPKALRFALAANELTGFSRSPYLDTLALAYHLNGQTVEAIDTQRKAIALLREGRPRSVVAEYEAHLAEYEAAHANAQTTEVSR